MFDPILFKKQFPLFDHPENASLVYLDNAATTQKPAVMIGAMIDFYQRTNANANRSSHRLGRAATEKVASARKKIAHFIHAKNEEEIVFTSGATEGLNIIANGLREQLDSEDEVVLSVAEHHANIVPWQEVARKTGAKIKFISPDFSDWENTVNKNTKVVSLTAASNALGTVSDFSIIEKIQYYNPNITIVVDASQLIAHLPIDVVAMDCDYLVFSAHKMYGPSGVGVLYGKKEALKKVAPLQFGGEMIAAVEQFSSEYVDGPERFEAGTSPLSAIVGFGAAIDFFASQDRQKMIVYENKLNDYLHQELFLFCSANPEFILLTCSKNNIGIAALSSNHYALADVAYWLDEHDIAVRVGDHCAQPLWVALGRKTAVLRMSLAAYNTFDDIDKLLSALSGFVTMVGQAEAEVETQVNIDELLSTKRWQQKYKKIVQWGRGYQSEKNIRKNENVVSGCEVDLWLDVERCRDRWLFIVDSDSDVVKGLALLIVSKVNNKTKAEIQAIDFPYFFASVGLDKYLSQSRVNGLNALLQRINRIFVDT